MSKVIKSKHQPKQTNVTWIDTGGETPIEKQFINGRWVPISSGNGGDGGGSSSGVQQIIAGTENITLDPESGTGTVTIGVNSPTTFRVGFDYITEELLQKIRVGDMIEFCANGEDKGLYIVVGDEYNYETETTDYYMLFQSVNGISYYKTFNHNGHVGMELVYDIEVKTIDLHFNSGFDTLTDEQVAKLHVGDIIEFLNYDNSISIYTVCRRDEDGIVYLLHVSPQNNLIFYKLDKSNDYWDIVEVDEITDGEDGKSAYEIAVDNGFVGTEQEWLASLKSSIGAFKFVATDATAEAAFSDYGETYASAIDGVSPSQATVSAILLMNNTAGTKTMMIATQEDGNSGYEFVYVGDLGSSMPSDILTNGDIVDNLDEGGSTKPLSAEQGKVLNEGKIDKIETRQERTELQPTGNLTVGYIDSTDGHLVTSETGNLRVATFSVTAGITYYITGRCATANSRACAAFYNTNDAMIGSAILGNDVSGVAARNLVEAPYVAPNGAVTLKIATSHYVTYPIKCEALTIVEASNNQDKLDSIGDVSELATTEKSTVVGAINELANAISGIGDVSGAVEKIDAIAETVVSPNMFDKSAMLNGYINSATGNIGSSSSSSYKMSDYIPVLPNHFYYLSGRTSNKVIRCLNADKSEIMKVLAASNGETVSTYTLPNVEATTNAVNGQFKTPANATFVQFNVIFAEGDSADSVMLTDVGDTYNPDYVVPAYQPYGSSTKVKSSAIDCDVTPTENSEKPITSGGVYEALQGIEPTPTPSTDKPLKILLIGSSHGMNTIAQLPFIASKSGIPVIVGNVYQGSMSMQWMLGGALRSSYNFQFKLWSDGSWGVTQSLPMTNILKLQDWDYISVQRSASDDEIWTTTASEVEELSSSMKENLNINHYQSGATAEYLDHNKTLQKVIDYIQSNTQNTPTILINSNFPDSGFYSTGGTPMTAIIQSIEKMKDNFGIEYYSTAAAIRNARGTFLQLLGNYIGSSYPEVNHNLTYDGQHIDYGIGCYLLSLCLLGFILKKKGIGIDTLRGYGTREEMGTNWWVDMSGTNIDRYTEPNEYTMACAKACVNAALLTPNAQNDNVRARFRWAVNYNLASGVTTSNNTPYCANQDNYETTLSGITTQTVSVTKQSSRSGNPVDITSQVYDSLTGKVVIDSVEGDIVITVA